MSSLANCIGRAGKLISPAEARKLEAAAASYRKEGFSADQANINAIEDVLRDLTGDLHSILEQTGLRGTPEEPKTEQRFEEGGPPAPPKKEKPAPVPGQPGNYFRSTPDSLIENGLDVARQIYTRRGHKAASDVAKEIVTVLGEDRAAQIAMDPRQTAVPGDVQTVIYGELLSRSAQTIAAADSTPEQRTAARRMIQRLQSEIPANFTDYGQRISALQQVYKDVRAATMAQYLDGVTADQNRRLGDHGKKAVTDAADAVNEPRDKAIDEATKEIEKALRKKPLTKALWQQYRDDTARRMLDWVGSRTTAPAEKASLQEFVDRVIAEMKGRIDPALPQRPDNPNPEPMPADLLREAIENKSKYADVLTSVRRAFADAYGEGSPVLDVIDTELANLGLTPYSKRLLDRAIKDAHRAMRTSVAELAKQHFTKTDAKAGDLAAGITAMTGLDGAEATQLAADLTDRVKELVAEGRKKALDRLRKQFGATRQTRAVLNAVERALELNNLGAMRESDLRELVAKKLGLPVVSEARMQKLAEIADRVETAPNTALRAQAELELANTLRVYRGFGPAELATSIWYANLLSGYTTQLANLQGNVFNGTLQLATVVAANPSKIGHAVGGWLEGFGEGWQDARSILARGYGRRDFDAKAGVSGQTLELVDYRRDFPKLPDVVARGLNLHAKALRYVFRLMKAVDATFYYPAKEAYTRVAVAKLLESEYSGKELRDKVRETLQLAPDVYENAVKQAEGEGFTGLDRALRAAGLIEEGRKRSAVGAQANEAGERFALETTFNNQPVGWAGVLYHHLEGLTDTLRPGGVPVLKAFLPFLRIPTNIFNASLNYTPVGALRAVRGMVEPRQVGPRVETPRREFNSDERARLLIQSIGGTVLMGGLYLMATGGDDDKEPWFTITATGPSDYRKQEQLRQTGWRDHAMKLGDVWISYKDSPLLVPLAVLGNMVDAQRYQKTKADLTYGSRLFDTLARGASTVFSTSMLSGLGTLVDFVEGRASADKVAAFLATIPINVAVPFANLLRQIDRSLDPTAREANGVGGRVGAAVPFVRNAGSPRTDVLGQPVNSPALARFGGLESNDPLREVLRDKNVFISTPNKDTKIGNRTMTPEEYRDYVKTSGEAIKRRLTPVVPRLRAMSSEQVKKLVDHVTREERDREKKRIQRMSPAPKRDLSRVFD